MIGRDRVIALIPVRGGSKGIPGKNRQDLGGHPLMAWAVKMAKSIQQFDRVVVSTEDQQLSNIAKSYGAEVAVRANKLSGDTVGVFDVIIDLKKRLRDEGESARYMFLLEVTSPFRTPLLFSEAMSFLEAGFDSVATFKECQTHPYKVWNINGEKINTFLPGANPWTTRQELPVAYELSGELYAFDLNILDPNVPSLMVGKCAPLIVAGGLSVDINDPKDLAVAREMFPQSFLPDLI